MKRQSLQAARGRLEELRGQLQTEDDGISSHIAAQALHGAASTEGRINRRWEKHGEAKHTPYTSTYLLRRYLDPPNPSQTPSQKVLGGLGTLNMDPSVVD